jgi:hypothetical protein
LQETGRLKGYRIYVIKEEPGQHRCVKDNEGKSLVKVCRVMEQEEDPQSDDDQSFISISASAHSIRSMV